MLVDRRRLAGQRGLDGAHLACGNDARIGRDLVARGEPDHVARHQVHRVHAPPPTVADHGHLGRQCARQGGQRCFGLAFLQVADHRVDDHHAEDH
jgi:hypothetical protein